MEEKTITLEDAIIDLFINVKIRDPDEVENFTEEEFEKERKKLKKRDPLKIVGDIKSCFEAIMNMNQESENSGKSGKSGKSVTGGSYNRMSFSKVADSPIEQERLMQKLESEIRSHISYEQQMKLNLEGHISQMEKIKNKRKKVKEEMNMLKEKLKKAEEELTKSNEELNKAKEEMKSKDNVMLALEANLKLLKDFFKKILNLNLNLNLKEENNKASRKHKTNSAEMEKQFSQNFNLNFEDFDFTNFDFKDIDFKNLKNLKDFKNLKNLKDFKSIKDFKDAGQGKNFLTYDSSEIYLKNFPQTKSNLEKANINSFPKNQFASYFSNNTNFSNFSNNSNNSNDFIFIKKGIRNKSTKTAFKSSFSNAGLAYKKPPKNYINFNFNYKKMNIKDQSCHMNSKSSDISMQNDSNLIKLNNVQFKAWKKGIFKQRLNYNNPSKNPYGYKSGDLITIKQLRKANTDAPIDYRSKDQITNNLCVNNPKIFGDIFNTFNNEAKLTNKAKSTNSLRKKCKQRDKMRINSSFSFY